MQTASEQAVPADGGIDEVLAAAVELAREVLGDDVPGDQIGDHLGVSAELSGSGDVVTHRFAARLRGYVGWYWAVSIARIPGQSRITANEVVLLPGDGAIETQPWVPWANRLQPGDLHPGDLVPTDPADERLAPGYLLSDDPQVERVAWELGLGRERVLSRQGRLDAAARWNNGSFGESSAMAKHAPARCGTCGFYLQLGGSMQTMFGACANEISPADGHVVTADYGCGAHSDATAELELRMATRRELIYNTLAVDLTKLRRGGALSSDRKAQAELILQAVLADAATRRGKKDAPAISPAAVLIAVRAAFAAREHHATPPKLSRSKK